MRCKPQFTILIAGAQIATIVGGNGAFGNGVEIASTRLMQRLLLILVIILVAREATAGPQSVQCDQHLRKAKTVNGLRIPAGSVVRWRSYDVTKETLCKAVTGKIKLQSYQQPRIGSVVPSRKTKVGKFWVAAKQRFYLDAGGNRLGRGYLSQPFRYSPTIEIAPHSEILWNELAFHVRLAPAGQQIGLLDFYEITLKNGRISSGYLARSAVIGQARCGRGFIEFDDDGDVKACVPLGVTVHVVQKVP